MPEVGETGAADEADIACPDHRHVHRKGSPANRSGRAFSTAIGFAPVGQRRRSEFCRRGRGVARSGKVRMNASIRIAASHAIQAMAAGFTA
jgi:hypothetical protein